MFMRIVEGEGTVREVVTYRSLVSWEMVGVNFQFLAKNFCFNDTTLSITLSICLSIGISKSSDMILVKLNGP